MRFRETFHSSLCVVLHPPRPTLHARAQAMLAGGARARARTCTTARIRFITYGVRPKVPRSADAAAHARP